MEKDVTVMWFIHFSTVSNYPHRVFHVFSIWKRVENKNTMINKVFYLFFPVENF